MAGHRQKAGIVLILLFFLTILVAEVSCAPEEYGVVFVRNLNRDFKKDYCMLYYPKFARLPDTVIEQKFKPLYYTSTLNTCDNSSTIPKSDDFKGCVVLTQIRNCSLATQVEVIQKGGGIGLLLFGSPALLSDEHASPDVHIPVGRISNSTADIMQHMTPNVDVYLYAPESSNFDYSLLLIWIIAVFSVVVGSYWSGLVRYRIYSKEVSQLPSVENSQVKRSSSQKVEGEESSISVSPLVIVIFVICMGLMLVLLYFYFKYLVYVIISLFVLASIISIYCCLEPLISKIPIGTCVLPKLPCAHCTCEVRQIILFLAAFGLALSWLLLRKESYSWILQNILGVAFCINMLRTIRLPNMQICTILLILLFFYDIFFVFITPLLTVKGESVMVEVATGGASGEQIPMVVRVPHLTFNALNVCRYLQYSLLGFGDILVPGLLVAYCHGFDLIVNTGRIYFITTSIGYAIGLIITFVGLYIMSTPQPALLYLVPATLLPLLIAGLIRKELSQLWWGVKRIHPNISEPQNRNGESENDNIGVPNGVVPVDNSCTAQDANNPNAPTDDALVSESLNELEDNKLLLK